MRVVCTLDTAAASISGKLFATAVKDEKRVRVSEEMQEAEAERLLAIPGFAPWSGTREEAATIDEAIEKIRQSEAAKVARRDDDKRTISELQAANQAMADELAAARQRIAELEAKINATPLTEPDEEEDERGSRRRRRAA